MHLTAHAKVGYCLEVSSPGKLSCESTLWSAANEGACHTSFKLKKGRSLFGFRDAACFDWTSEIWYKDKELESSKISVKDM